jgi:hypothetical protein
MVFYCGIRHYCFDVNRKYICLTKNCYGPEEMQKMANGNQENGGFIIKRGKSLFREKSRKWCVL